MVTQAEHDQKLALPYLIHFSMGCPETWYIESHILCLDATQVWEPDIEFSYFYFVDGDPSMTRNSKDSNHHVVHVSSISQQFAMEFGK